MSTNSTSDSKAIVPIVMETVCHPTQNAEFKSWLTKCPDMKMLEEAVKMYAYLNEDKECEYCGQEEKRLNLRDTREMVDEECNVCRECWGDMYPKFAWPESRLTKDQTRPEPLAHGYIYNDQGHVIGEVTNYQPDLHTASKVMLYGREDCAEAGPLEPDCTVKTTYDPSKKRKVRVETIPQDKDSNIAYACKLVTQE